MSFFKVFLYELKSILAVISRLSISGLNDCFIKRSRGTGKNNDKKRQKRIKAETTEKIYDTKYCIQ